MKAIATCLAVVALAFRAVAYPTAESTPSTREAVTIEQIRRQAESSPGIPAFVAWLERQANVSEVDYNANLFFTTHPPHQLVTFSVDGHHHRFLLLRGAGGRVTLTRDEQLK